MNNQRKPDRQNVGHGPGGGRGPMRGMMMVEKPKEGKKTLKRLIKYIGSSKNTFILLMVFVTIVTILSLVGPYLQGEAMDLITITPEKLADPNYSFPWEDLLLMLYGMAITYVFSAIFTYFQSLFSAKLSRDMIIKMRNDLFGHIVRLPISYIDSHQHGDIMS